MLVVEMQSLILTQVVSRESLEDQSGQSLVHIARTRNKHSLSMLKGVYVSAH